MKFTLKDWIVLFLLITANSAMQFFVWRHYFLTTACVGSFGTSDGITNLTLSVSNDLHQQIAGMYLKHPAEFRTNLYHQGQTVVWIDGQPFCEIPNKIPAGE